MIIKRSTIDYQDYDDKQIELNKSKTIDDSEPILKIGKKQIEPSSVKMAFLRNKKLSLNERDLEIIRKGTLPETQQMKVRSPFKSNFHDNLMSNPPEFPKRMQKHLSPDKNLLQT